MNKLQEAGLYRSQLMPISGILVERYNKCLTLLGFMPTQLTSFSIDGAGWSPEISQEKDDVFYLNNGDSNPHAIIISPFQKGKPVYNPFHSFDHELLNKIFKTYERQINDITRDCAICVDLDQDIDAFYEPLDILKYNTISVGFRLIDDLDNVQQRQFQLIDTFRQGNNFVDEQLHIKLLASAKKYGDLRHRNLHLPDLDYTTESFYTQAFGGVFVLRDFVFPIVIFESEKWYKEAIKDTTHEVLIYHISQKELIAKLEDHVIIETNLKEAVQTERYDRVKKQVFSEEIKETQHPIKDILNDKMLFRAYLNKLDMSGLNRVMCVERFLEKIEYSNEVKASSLDQKFVEALYKPHSSLGANQQDIIWKLLVKISPKDPLFLYWYDKNAFYNAYKSWDASYQDWVIEQIKKNIYTS